MSATWKDEDAKKVLEQFKKEMENLGEKEIPPNVVTFMEFVERLKEDKEALSKLREEIIKNYGE